MQIDVPRLSKFREVLHENQSDLTQLSPNNPSLFTVLQPHQSDTPSLFIPWKNVNRSTTLTYST